MEEHEESMPVPVVEEPLEGSQVVENVRPPDNIEVEEVLQHPIDIDEARLWSENRPILLGMPLSTSQQQESATSQPDEQQKTTSGNSREERPVLVSDDGQGDVSVVQIEGDREGSVRSVNQEDEANANQATVMDDENEEKSLDASTLVSSLRMSSAVQSAGRRDENSDETGGREDVIENAPESDIVSSFTWDQ